MNSLARLPLIRHVRWFVLTVRFNLWWSRVGQYLGAFPNESDLMFLDDVWEGRA